VRLEHRFDSGSELEPTWRALLDLDQMIGRLAQARLDRRRGDSLYVGAVTLIDGDRRTECSGALRSLGHDEDRRALALRFEGRQADGAGIASGVVAARVSDADGAVSVVLEANVAVAGVTGPVGMAAQSMFDALGGDVERALTAALDRSTAVVAPASPPRSRLRLARPLAWGAVAVAVIVAARRITARGRR
jgi:carbon monoxide dehydrogenase subunit G